MSFSDLGLSAPLTKAFAAQFEKPTPIQEQAIPAIVKGSDVFGMAQTGTGKTAAYVLPILERIQYSNQSRNRHVKVLVMVPTRELAVQVEEVFKEFERALPVRLKTMAVYGGVSVNPQMMKLSGTEILVATPGRLLDLVQSNAVKLSDVEILVLDEADKMLNLGFEEEMARIFALLPRKRQTVLLSATLSKDIEAIHKQLLRQPVQIRIEEEPENIDLIKQLAYLVDTERKGPLLRYLIKERNLKQVLIFTSSTLRADAVAFKLNGNGIKAMAMHSKKSQGARTEALNKFKSGRLRVLVATDLASRGIDIVSLPIVINYELPRSPKDYIHRIGRTGRAGNEGEAISLIAPEESHHFYIIQKKMKKKVELLETKDLDLKGF